MGWVRVCEEFRTAAERIAREEQPVSHRPPNDSVLLPTSRRYLDALREHAEPGVRPQCPNERHVLHQWNVRETARLHVCRAGNNKSLIAVRQARNVRSQSGTALYDPIQPTNGSNPERERERVPVNVGERALERRARTRIEPNIGMEKTEHAGTGCRRTRTELPSASTGSHNDCGSARHGNAGCRVHTATVDDDDLVRHPYLREVAEERGQRRRFIEGWNDERDHRPRHATAPPHELPAPAVHPKQCGPTTISRPSSVARPASKIVRGAPALTERSSI